MDNKTYRFKKWAKFVAFMDLDKDNVLSFEEYMFFPLKMIASGQVDFCARLALLYKASWDKILQGAGRDVSQLQMDVTTFQVGFDLGRQTQSFKEEMLPAALSITFDSIDTNHDGEISIVEWRTMITMSGIPDETFIKDTFNKMDENKDGVISKEEFRHAYTTFMFGDDENEDYSFLFQRKA